MLTVGGLFDGIGLLAYGLCRAGLEHRWLCEVDPFRRQVLARRWPGVPIYDDVRAVGAGAERVDVIAGGFPCKGASSAGKRNGFDHPETVLWREMARAVGELRPRYVVVENVADLLSVRDGAVWGEVLGTLAALGFDVVWDCVPAGAFGAPHIRDRVIAIATDTSGRGFRQGERSLREGQFHPQGRGAIAGDASHAAGEPERAPHHEADAVAGEGRARALPRSGDCLAASVAEGERRAEAEPALQQSGLESLSRGSGDAAADSGEWGCKEREAGDSSESARPYAHPLGRGVPVEWGPYGPAIRRWEAVIGAAPEPLVRRVDDRSTMRVERSRLFALGDGVQVQLGELVGRYVIGLEGEVAA